MVSTRRGNGGGRMRRHQPRPFSAAALTNCKDENATYEKAKHDNRLGLSASWLTLMPKGRGGL